MLSPKTDTCSIENCNEKRYTYGSLCPDHRREYNRAYNKKFKSSKGLRKKRKFIYQEGLDTSHVQFERHDGGIKNVEPERSPEKVKELIAEAKFKETGESGWKAKTAN